ncbi:MAG: DMT family transporter [Sphaerochaetaceae bacterium]|nr:DMT family transporter [Sphaerochaetaceae bacterium]
MKEKRAVLLLLFASFIWGTTFVVQSNAADLIPPFSYNGIRMLLGSLCLSPFLISSVKEHKNSGEFRKNIITGGVICGIEVGLACTVQQIGISMTTAGKAGFITSLYILVVPVLSLVAGKKVSPRTWICVMFGLIGAFVLSVNGATPVNRGDLVVFTCSFIFAIHIITVDYFVGKLDGPDLSCVQFFFGGLMNLVIGLIFEECNLQMIKSAMFNIFYSGVLSCGVAYTLQIIGQKHVQPAKATLALSLESAWAAVSGAVFLGERMSLKELTGCVILFSAVIISQLPEKSGKFR